ncbi:COG1669 Predicted nucleotidyltransferases [Burkholderiales bacterium]|jgi:predicted nucleotidyltransferase
MHPIIETNRTELKQLGDRYGALSVSAFGSMARGDASADSDVDLLIEPGRALSGFDLGALLMDAQELLGRRVDIVTLNALHPLMRERVLAEAIRL